MISVAAATAIVQDNAIALGIEHIPFAKAMGRILAEDLMADRDFPPFNRITMDGIAIHYDAFEQGQRAFVIAGVGPAGSPQQTLHNKQQCLEIMTGAILPAQADTIIRYEDVVIEEGVATIQIDTIRRGQNIHRQGEDRLKDSIITPKGTRISAAEIGVATTIGKSQLAVYKLPKIVVLSTGDELVSVDATPLPHQIRASNVHQIQAQLQQWGIVADTLHLPDQADTIKAKLGELLDQYDAIVMSGGVSMGKFDYIPQALNDLGVTQLFHKIKQRPGKPFWFGRHADGCVVFALPGNPVSTFMCTNRYIYPWLHKSWQTPPLAPQYAVLAEDFTFKKDLTYFLQVKLESTAAGQLLAHPYKGRGSGDHANLTNTDAFMELPAEQEDFKKGSVFPIWQYR